MFPVHPSPGKDPATLITCKVGSYIYTMGTVKATQESWSEISIFSTSNNEKKIMDISYKYNVEVRCYRSLDTVFPFI